ncbi:MAG: ribonuclease D [Martelella sp.]|uniref:ribonuclease D n=1 Tax=unclassified Martelella TaxID=2629616 RepID=UPI000C657A47|nr:ribonuclease D [Martelella sp.]MAU19246.1 ribonuclease D [Martelella sp.]MAU20472.1 ribonuclease D [Martelella sp.]
MIETTAALAEACATLAKSDFVTIDTEFIRESTFWPELCLIQMASPDLEVLVDPLAKGIDLKPFFELMADASVVKVFHAARQDLEIVYHLGNMLPSPLFDTQVAAMVCGFGDSVSYDQLVSRITGAHIDKSSRFTDWRARPLNDKQLSYALADVTHLRDVYLKLKEQLESGGRTDWVEEEMAILENPQTYDLPPEMAWTRLKLRIKKPIDFAVMQKVAEWRETEARERNQPRRRVLKDDTIYEIAQQHPTEPEALAKLRMIPRGWERSQPAAGLLEAVKTALAIPKADLPRLPRQPHMPEGAAAAAELLKVLLKIVAEQNQVAARVIASSDDLDKIAAEGENADVEAMKGWRRKLYGEPALRLLNGDVALRFIDKKVEMIEV